MNRSFFNVMGGGFGSYAATASSGGAEQRWVKSGSADDAAFVLANAKIVVIVPRYALAVARAQHAVKEFAERLTKHGVTVKYAIHPVAGRLPGHMNVLLAEAEVPTTSFSRWRTSTASSARCTWPSSSFIGTSPFTQNIMKSIKSFLSANRGKIAICEPGAASEMGIRAVVILSNQLNAGTACSDGDITPYRGFFVSWEMNVDV